MGVKKNSDVTGKISLSHTGISKVPTIMLPVIMSSTTHDAVTKSTSAIRHVPRRKNV